MNGNTIYDVFKVLVGNYTSRETITELANKIAKVSHIEYGDYDSGKQGYIVVQIDNVHYRIDFSEDSYSSGYTRSNMDIVTPIEKTITVWE